MKPLSLCLLLLPLLSLWSQSYVTLAKNEYQMIQEMLKASEKALIEAQTELESLRADLERLSSESDLLRSELTRLSIESARLEQSWKERVSEVTEQLESERIWRWTERALWAAAIVAALMLAR